MELIPPPLRGRGKGGSGHGHGRPRPPVATGLVTIDQTVDPAPGGFPLVRRPLALAALCGAVLVGTPSTAPARALRPAGRGILPPVILSHDSPITSGRSFELTTTEASQIAAVLVAPVTSPTSTVSLEILGRSGNTLTVLAPTTAQEPPGAYLLSDVAQTILGALSSLPVPVTIQAPPPPPPVPTPTTPAPRGSAPGSSPAPTGAQASRGGGGLGSPGTGAESPSGSPSGSAQGPPVQATGGAGADQPAPTGGQGPLGSRPWLALVVALAFVATFVGLRRLLQA